MMQQNMFLLLEAIIKRCPNRARQKAGPQMLVREELRQLRKNGMVNCEGCILRDLDAYWWEVCRKEAHERQAISSRSADR